jgi:hypothetical protein
VRFSRSPSSAPIDDEHQHHDREDPHGAVGARGEGRERARTDHAHRDGDQHDGDDLHDLAELQPELALGVEVLDREVGDERDAHGGQHRVDRGQADVERDVAAEQVAEQVRRRAAGRGGEQHHADGQQRVDVERLHQARTRRRQDETCRPSATATARGGRATRRKSPGVRDSPRPNMMIASAIGRPDGDQGGVVHRRSEEHEGAPRQDPAGEGCGEVETTPCRFRRIVAP